MDYILAFLNDNSISRLCENLQETSRHGQSRKIHSKTQARSWCGVVQRWETWLLKSFIQNYIKNYYFKISSIRHDLVLLSQVVSLWLSEATSASTQNQGQSWHIAGAVKRYIWPIARNVDQFIDTFKMFEIVLFFFRISATLPKQSILPFLPFSFWSSPSQSDLN